MFNTRDSRRVRVEAAVPDVSVRVLNRGKLVTEGVTPFEVDLDSSAGYFKCSKYEFQFSGNGFSPMSVYREGYVTGNYWLNLIIIYTAPIGMLLVDPLTGSMFEIEGGSVFAGAMHVAPREKPSGRTYRVLSIERVEGGGMSYDFTLALTESFDISGVKEVQDEIGEMVRNAYVGSNQAVSRQDVRVDFPSFRIMDGKAAGRAVAVAITVVLMNYDDSTHKGIIRVRYPDAQYEVARKWVREHIENLARDKNIALTTGEIPPAARFYLGAERVLDGNVM